MATDRPARKPTRTAGRPRLLRYGRRLNVYLDDQSLDRARRIGAGNVSEGIRHALERYGLKKAKTPQDQLAQGPIREKRLKTDV